MLQAAVFSGDPSGGIGSNQPAPLPTGTVFSFSGGAFVIAEASYLPNQAKGASGLPGTYRIGAWYHTSSHFADQRFDNTGLSLASPQSTGIPLEHTGDFGFYGMVDQTLYRVPGTDDQGLSAFFRAGRRSQRPQPDQLLCRRRPALQRPGAGPSRRQGRYCLCRRARRRQRARTGCRHRTVRKLLLSGAQQRGDDRDDVSSENEAVVDAATRTPIHHPAGWRRAQPRWQPPTERLGHRPSLDAEFLGPCKRGPRQIRFGSTLMDRAPPAANPAT